MALFQTRHTLLAVAVGGLAALGIALAWRTSTLSAYATPEHIGDLLAVVKGEPWAIGAVVAMFVLGGLMACPMNLLVLATAAVFGPWLGIAYSATGSLCSGLVLYGIGAGLGRDAVQRQSSERWQRALSLVRRRGFLTVVAGRLVPIPYTLVCLAAGASGIAIKDYFFGTLIGMIPGWVLLSIMGDRLVAVLAGPTVLDIAVLALCAAALVAIALLARLWLVRRREGG
jgi:uncharacterized membrane protein YdjX (TVP38/TMEM64 family)